MDQHNPIEPREASIFDGLTDLQKYEYSRGVKRARNTLFAVGIILFAFDMIYSLFQDFTKETFLVVLVIDTVILASFIGLGFLTKKKPFIAILSGLILYVGIQVAVAAMNNNWASLFSGFIVKAIIIGLLVKGLIDGRKLQDLIDRETQLNR